MRSNRKRRASQSAPTLALLEQDPNPSASARQTSEAFEVAEYVVSLAKAMAPQTQIKKLLDYDCIRVLRWYSHIQRAQTSS